MNHKLREIRLNAPANQTDSKAFALRQLLVAELYVHNLSIILSSKISKISITIDEDDSVGELLSGVISAKAMFDENRYASLTDDDKNRQILDTIHRIALLCAEKFNWERASFENAYQKVLDMNFKYAVEGIRKFSKDRKHKASILIEKNLKYTLISVVFYDKNDKYLGTVELLKSFLNDIFYKDFIKNAKWFNNAEFGIFILNHELVIKAKVGEDKSDVVLKPILKTQEELEGYLRWVTYHELNNNEDIVNWMNR